jgi:hypothetical protein
VSRMYLGRISRMLKRAVAESKDENERAGRRETPRRVQVQVLVDVEWGAARERVNLPLQLACDSGTAHKVSLVLQLLHPNSSDPLLLPNSNELSSSLSFRARGSSSSQRSAVRQYLLLHQRFTSYHHTRQGRVCTSSPLSHWSPLHATHRVARRGRLLLARKRL